VHPDSYEGILLSKFQREENVNITLEIIQQCTGSQYTREQIKEAEFAVLKLLKWKLPFSTYYDFYSHWNLAQLTNN